MTHEELLAKLSTICPSGCSIRNEHWHEPLDGYTNKYLNALRAVVELHKPYSDTFYNGKEYTACSKCLDDTGQSLVYYPCPTIQAIEKELNG